MAPDVVSETVGADNRLLAPPPIIAPEPPPTLMALEADTALAVAFPKVKPPELVFVNVTEPVPVPPAATIEPLMPAAPELINCTAVFPLSVSSTAPLLPEPVPAALMLTPAAEPIVVTKLPVVITVTLPPAALPLVPLVLIAPEE